ncbi:hypothetical protein Q9Q94_08225 [Uliginosibacterium sp. 31-16]|uniref:hypothetical protein n=1 Tax=Uliginosibacterium sp. 31-16 TaxID=3068315 RepID=UPI00273E1866|nr:hypothetical protein [Uliginosibacterium sp. 31-16]MDP5239512.1 hypothetical protein [Uliginosibacterium sp. 31-16]
MRKQILAEYGSAAPEILKEWEAMAPIGLERIDAPTPSAFKKDDLMPNATPAGSALREHWFSVAIARHVFEHPDFGIVFARDTFDLTTAARYGLRPIVVYGVTVAGAGLRHLVFAPANEPLSFLTMLQNLWRTSPVLRGRPDVLKISRNVDRACPELVDNIKKLGVQLAVADGKDKQFAAVLRYTHQTVLEIFWSVSLSKGTILTSMADLDAAASSHAASDALYRSQGRHRSGHEAAEQAQAWMALPVRPLTTTLPHDVPWLSGKWLHAWENDLPPAPALKMLDSNGVKFMIHDEEPILDEDEFLPQDFYDAAKKVKLLVANWPNPPVEIAKALGITLRELNWFAGAEAPLAQSERTRLLSMLGVERRNFHAYYDCVGPCVLVAKSPSVTEAYEDLSCGGDLKFSFEALPCKGLADPSWRYLVFGAHGQQISIIMVPRGSAIASRMDKTSFMNFRGSQEVPTHIYQDIVASCARACLRPQDNRKEMMAFSVRFEKHASEINW